LSRGRYIPEPMDLSELLQKAPETREQLAVARRAIGDEIIWYHYDILANLAHLDALLNGENRDLGRLAGGLPVADIGAADGDLAFMLEQTWGWEIDVVDHGPTNQNHLEGARALRDYLGSRVQIEDIDLDSQFRLPRERYGLVLLLGILYHLQNPFYVLRELSARAENCLLSTRVARFAGPGRTPIGDLPVAYLVGPSETNNDATNYWMFAPAGLRRIVARAGWSIVESVSVGDVDASDPSSLEHDERMLLLLRSTRVDHPATESRPAEAGQAGGGASSARGAPASQAPHPQSLSPTGDRDLAATAAARRTAEIHEARGALAEAVSLLSAELDHHRQEQRQERAQTAKERAQTAKERAQTAKERAQTAEEILGLRDHTAALNHEIDKLRQAYHVALEQNAELRNMKVVRWTARPRRLVYRLRARRG
jgi:tRNA (mo5U34)-methyltransferase